MPSLLRQPVLQFLILGAVLFGLYVAFGETDDRAEGAGTIVVSSGDVEALVQGWMRTWQRPPTQDELVGLVENHIEEELFYRQALALGLDRDDTIVRRRLQQKLEFLAADLSTIEPPDDATLQAYFEENIGRYTASASMTFTQVFIDPVKHGDSLDSVVADSMNALEAGAAPDGIGDPFLLPMEFTGVLLDSLARQFGGGFVAALVEQETGRWTGPVESSFGLHLVFIRERAASSTPYLADVRDEVTRDWYAEERAIARAEFLRALAAGYMFVIEWPDGFEPPRPLAIMQGS